MGRTYTLTIDGRSAELEVSRVGDAFQVRIGDRVHSISLSMISGNRLFSLLVDGASYEVYASPRDGAFELLVGNELYDVEVERGHGRGPAGRAGASPDAWVLRSPMTGIVAEVAVEGGQSIERGDVLVVLESMKMKNELRSDQRGTVERVEISPGQQVQRGERLISLKVSPPDVEGAAGVA